MSILHEAIMGQSEIGIQIDLGSSWWEKIAGILLAIVVGIAVIGLLIYFAPGAISIIFTALKTVATVLAASGVTSVMAVGGVLVAASALLAERLFRSHVFTSIFLFTRRNF